jgi:hypothetical protein
LKSLIDTIKSYVNTPRVDEYLHFSTDLQNPRHTCINWLHGQPTVDKPWMNTFPLLQGSAVHEYIHTIFHDDDRWKYVSEQPIFVEDREFPWKGTVDAYLEDKDGTPWLIDYKTASGVSLSFMNEPKPEHVLQASAYYHYGISIPGLRVGIVYLPSSPDYKRRWEEPRFYEVQPLSKDTIDTRMTLIEDYIIEYVKTGTLPDPLAGEYNWKHNKKAKVWEEWYKPHYTSLYCPWKDEEADLCGCSIDKARIVATSDIDPTEMCDTIKEKKEK